MDGTLPPHVVAGAPAPSLQLRPLVRERKGLLSMDNVGGAKGGKVVSRAIKLLSSLPKSSRPAESVTGLMGGVSCDTSEVERRWWTRTRESRKQAVARAREMLSQLQSSEHSTVVVVSHSHFLRSTFAEFLSEGACAPELAAALRTKKVPNCGVVVCTLAPDGKLTRAAIGYMPTGSKPLVAEARRDARRKPSGSRVAPNPLTATPVVVPAPAPVPVTGTGIGSKGSRPR